MIDPEETEAQKEALKEALKEWMDEKFAIIGKWSIATLAVAVVGLLTWAILILNGWKHLGG